MKPVVAITLGDFNGIGPEVALKSALHPSVRRLCTPLLIGAKPAFEFYARRYRLPAHIRPLDGSAESERAGRGAITLSSVESSAVSAASVRPGLVSGRAGGAAARAVEAAVRLVQSGVADAIVTAPVSKRAMHLAGVDFPGQTEMVQHLSGASRVVMMLVCSRLRVGLITIHVPVREVARLISGALLRERIQVIDEALRNDWGIRQPALAVLGLNPHAGESGDLGAEEKQLIAPTLQQLRRTGLSLAGPFPADAFFARYKPGSYDAVVAMYHDQGLIPLKMLAAGRGVNVSLGLPVVRTSPDHGTGFDIAGKGTADPASMIEAIKLAVLIATHRRSARGKLP
ncbi:4-hydroxythreonine-4-phosphate dehydrogenase PdxA [bacterium]|nr:MAG: 4-hydroxythreonine-4-phosphate dehydrogenase PdxA [bacterium]